MAAAVLLLGSDARWGMGMSTLHTSSTLRVETGANHENRPDENMDNEGCSSLAPQQGKCCRDAAAVGGALSQLDTAQKALSTA